MFNWFTKLFKTTPIPMEEEVRKIVKDVLKSNYPNPCARISARVARLYINNKLDATVYSGVLLRSDPRVRQRMNRHHAVVVVSIGKELWQLDATTTPMRWSRKKPVFEPNTTYVCSRNELMNATEGSIWF